MKILNLGSMNIDYVYQMDHFILPGETQSSTSLSVNCGGKGLNQSVALAKAGTQVYHACRIGAEGGFLAEKLKEKGVITDLIAPGTGSCGHAIIQVNPEGQNCIILYGGTNLQMDRDYIDAVLREFGEGDVLVLQNEVNNIPYMIQRAWEKGMKIAFNAAPFQKEVTSYPLEKLTWLIVNEVEGAELSGVRGFDEILHRLHTQYPRVGILLTMGRAGSMYCAPDGSIARAAATSVKAVDTTAAGDTFVGYFIRGMLDGMPAAGALHLAAVASGISVTRPGAADSVPAYEEVLRWNQA